MFSSLAPWLYAVIGSCCAAPIPSSPDPSPAHLLQHRLSSEINAQESSLPMALPCLSGIINAYTPVLGFGCDSSSLQVGTLSGFMAGDKVLLIQMQVPQVDLSNTPSFGALLNTTCIGNYEFNRVLSLANGSIQLQFALTQPYDLSGKIQLVRVPEYDSAMVCGITCLPWNGTVGGVLALEVKNQLSLSGAIDVSGKGFRGGQVEANNVPWVFGEQQFFYAPISTLAAQKGEGIVAIPVDFSYGRGRAGNGGGGGNAHNAGGGGGANAGAGGDGGLEITFPFTPATPNTNGLGGQKYFDNQTNKVLMGGGGGAGHANDQLGSSGGSGGGIAFVMANTLQPNGFRLLANGADVVGGQEHNDGQGGGGGGGTIVLQVGNLTGALNCELKGGRGGSNPYTPQNQIHGPGGGGGGGKLLITQNMPNVVPALQGGSNGFSSLNFTNGAMPGEAGKLLTGVSIPEGATPSHPVSNQMLLALNHPICGSNGGGQISVLQSTALAFRLNGGPWQTDSVFTALGPGTYQISLQFSGGCSLDTVAVLNAPLPVLDTLIALTDAGCANGGALNVAALSGTAPFEFQLNGGIWQPSGLFTGLPSGNHTVVVRDAAGCTDQGDYLISGPAPVLDSLLLLQQATCINGGAIAVAAISGMAPFEFQLNGGAWQSSGMFNDLPPATYQIALRDAAGCVHNSSYSVTSVPPALDSLVSLTDATCVAGGAVVATVISGTPPFAFQLNGGPWQPGSSFSNLPPADYLLRFQDGAGCTDSSYFSILSPPELKDSLTLLQNATCLSGGSISVTAVSGTVPIAFQLNGGPFQPNGTFANLPVADYTLTLQDAAGCVQSSTYSIAPPPVALDSLVFLYGATCLNGGAISLSAISGTAPFEFQLNQGAWQTGGLFEDLPPTNYTVLMRDAAGCVDSSVYTITAPPPAIDSLISLSNANCDTGGAIELAAISGTAPFEFQLNGGPWQPDGSFANLPAGNYTVRMRDSAGCEQSRTIMIAAPPPVQNVLLAILEATCTQGGSIQLEAIAGTPPFEFQLNGGPWQALGTFDDLPPANYTITMRDGAHCLVGNVYNVPGPAPVLDSLILLTNATCNSGGAISLTAVSGLVPFEFQLNGGPWQSNGTFANLPPGNYNLITRDAADCTHSSQYTVAPPPQPLDTLLLLQGASCVAGGAITVSPIAGTPPFEFQLNGGAWQPNGVFSDLPPATYSIAMRDGAACVFWGNYTVQAPPPVSDSLIAITSADCHAGGSVAVVATEGTPPFLYQLDGGAWQNDGNFTALPAGSHVIAILDAAHCMATSDYTIEEASPLMLKLDSLGNIDCQHPTGFVAVSATGGAGGYAYQVGQVEPLQNAGHFILQEAGLYTFTVRDSAGCEAVLPNQVVQSLVDSAFTEETVTIYEGSFFRLPDGRQTGKAGQYFFYYETVKGCDSLHLIEVIVLKRHIYVPNVFLPGDSGHNRFFTVYSDASLETVKRLAVYDRWGELVYERQNLLPNDEENGWDGYFRSQQVNPGVFVWVASLRFVDGLEVLIRGDVTVLR